MVTMEANRTLTPSLGRLRPQRTRLAAAALSGALLASSALVLLAPEPANAEVTLPVATRLVSRENAGGPVKGFVDRPSISGDGRFVAFTTAVALVPEDTNAKTDVYVRDRWAATTELVSQTSAEAPLDAASTTPSLSDDGRYVAFVTDASNLIPGDNKDLDDVFVRDRYAGTTTRASMGVGGALASHDVYRAQISGNGRHVAMLSLANNLVAGDTNDNYDIFVRDLDSNETERVSVTSSEAQVDADHDWPSISDDGQMVAFTSMAVIGAGVVGKPNVYVRVRGAEFTLLVNRRDDEGLPNDGAYGGAISGNGTVVAFSSEATNLVSGDTNGTTDVFVRDIALDTTKRVSVSDSEQQLTGHAGTTLQGIDDDGTVVLFSTQAVAAPGTDAGDDWDLYLRDVSGGTTRRLSTGPNAADPASNTFDGSVDDLGANVALRITQKLTSDANFDQAYVQGTVRLGPFPNANALISQQFQDFLGRAPTSAETSDWATRFTNGSADPATLVAQLNANPAWADARAPMVRLYWAFFLRRPDAGGLTYWLGRYQGGTSLATIAQSFAASSEFKNRYGNVGNEAYVKLVYQNVFERQPDANGLKYWTDRLNAMSITRGGVIVAFSESSEGKRRLAGPTNITLLSLAMLRTVPNAGLWNVLYPTIDAGERQPAWIARQLLANGGYENRFE
jgi:Tol biopolymer transport system component